MFARSKAGHTKEPLFRVRVGHVLLAVSTAAMIVSLAVWSLVSMQVHEADKNQIFAQESDSAALTFVQRESFSVLLKIEQTGGIACHTGRHSCFYQRLDDGRWTAVEPVLKDPEHIYK